MTIKKRLTVHDRSFILKSFTLTTSLGILVWNDLYVSYGSNDILQQLIGVVRATKAQVPRKCALVLVKGRPSQAATFPWLLAVGMRADY